MLHRWLGIIIFGINLLLSSYVSAKVWLLPDYSLRQVNSHRVNIPGKSGHVVSSSPETNGGFKCSNYSHLKDVSNMGVGEECVEYFYGPRICCSKWRCHSSYSKTVNSCREEGKVPDGEACDGTYYQSCKCDTNIYPYTSSYCDIAPSGTSCSDAYGTFYESCVCLGKTKVTCGKALGCATYCDEGRTFCTECNPTPNCGTGRYWDDELGCLKVPCADGYATTASDCLGTVTNGYWGLGSISNGQSGDALCYACEKKCNNGLVLDGDECVCAPGYIYSDGECKPDNIKFTVNVTSTTNGYIYVIPSYGDYVIDWGDGTSDSGVAMGSSKHHTYSATGNYDITVSGTITGFKVASNNGVQPIAIKSLSLSTITDGESMFSGCSSLAGSIPELPPNLTSGKYMFQNCSSLTGSIPELPPGLTNGYNMFYNCKKLSGNIPELPTGLTDGSSMFYGCTGLSGNIPELPTGLTDGSGMFYGCTGLSGNIPELPDGLTDGGSMFNGCTGLSGNIPELPTGLTGGSYMFRNCTSLSGNIPELPTGLTVGASMFSGCTGLSGNVPELPSGLTDGSSMFYGCTGLSGNIPELPTGLTSGSNMFYGCTGLSGNIPELPTGLTNGYAIFYGCKGLSGNIPELPTGLTNGYGMFYGCTGLSGNIPDLPTGLTYGASMFYGCTGLSGNVPELPTGLTNGSSMFYGCTGLSGNIPELPSVLTDGAGMFSGCTGLSGNVPELPTGLTYGGGMFSGCTGLSGTAPAKPSKLNSYRDIFYKTQVTNDGSWPDTAW